MGAKIQVDLEPLCSSWSSTPPKEVNSWPSHFKTLTFFSPWPRNWIDLRPVWWQNLMFDRVVVLWSHDPHLLTANFGYSCTYCSSFSHSDSAWACERRCAASKWTQLSDQGWPDFVTAHFLSCISQLTIHISSSYMYAMSQSGGQQSKQEVSNRSPLILTYLLSNSRFSKPRYFRNKPTKSSSEKTRNFDASC